MPGKRKRPIIDTGDTNEDAVVEARRDAALLRHLQRSQRAVARGLKLAKAFEKQKLTRRRKRTSAASGPVAGPEGPLPGDAFKDAERKDKESLEETLARFDAEEAALKAMNVQSTARRYLRKMLLKEKGMGPVLRARGGVLDEALPPPVGANGQDGDRVETVDEATANVLGRMCKARATVEAITEAKEGVRRVLGLGGGMAGNGKGEKRQRKGPRKEQEEEADMKEYKSARRGSPEYGAYDVEHIQRPSQKGNDESAQPNGPAPTPPDSTHDHFAPHARRGTDVGPSASPAPAADGYDLPTCHDKSAFLPSLTTGGYWSGGTSESDSEDDLRRADFSPEPEPQRRNRPGQRARRQLWEQKYGREARHLQQAQRVRGAAGPASRHGNGGKRDKRSEGWDAKRGARPTDGKKGWTTGKCGGDFSTGRFGGPGVGGGAGRKKGEGKGAKEGKRDDEGKLHPSWEAAKRAKEQKMSMEFKGKKVVFD
ncbi:Bud-site selection protein [Lineolata rhizophorae]|uniref:Bud-site selection protein n=1 Tax=Lineolata rhizophorae TaxID=578093 RepID=A0A6A6NMG7_9PEZI|nr:Bud-site selection protein [Lineolata rhizophorae]